MGYVLNEQEFKVIDTIINKSKLSFWVTKNKDGDTFYDFENEEEEMPLEMGLSLIEQCRVGFDYYKLSDKEIDVYANLLKKFGVVLREEGLCTQ